MITMNYIKKCQKLYYEKLSNGLEIYMFPNSKMKGYNATLITRYGSNIKKFIPIGETKYCHLPLGVAHFLEHKMFDMEDNDPFTFYSKTGTYANAGTNYYSTRYYIHGDKCFKKNLDFLLDMVYTPFFTDVSVQKEMGIIKEEIKMYDDEIEYTLDDMMKHNLFQYNVLDKIAGTCSSIEKITKEILFKTWQTFYQPSNMALIVTGNFKTSNVIEIVKNNKALNKMITNMPIKYLTKKDTKKVNNEYSSLKDHVMIPKLKYSFKFDLNTFGLENSLLVETCMNIIFQILLGESSAFYEKILNEGLATGYYVDYCRYENIYIVDIEAESNYADIFKDEIDKLFSNIIINEEDLERIKRVMLATEIRISDSVETLNDCICEEFIYDTIKIEKTSFIKSISINDINKIISKLDLSNKSFIIMFPEE